MQSQMGKNPVVSR